MSHLTLVAKITAKAGHEQFVQEGLQSLVAPTRQEAGCLQYDLHQDQENPATFIFIEKWESAAHLQAHSGAPHIKAFGEAANGMIAERKLHLLNKL